MNENTTTRNRLARLAATALTVLAVMALVWAATVSASSPLRGLFAPAASPPALVSYQGFVKVSSSPYTGTGYFKFAVMNAASGDGTTNYWANDGAASGQPSAPVALAVTGGLFDVMLGDTSLAGMSQPITQNAFTENTTYLRVWFSQTAGGPFQALDPNQRIGSAAYALRAERALLADIAIGIGDNANSCTAALSGNLRWTGSDYQLCDGFNWRTVQLSEGKVIVYQANNAIGISGAAIGGRAGADTKCQTASNKPAGYGNYRALISVSDADEIRDMPANYGIPTSYTLRSSTGNLIANNWADLLDGSIYNALGATGVYVSGPYEWWSGSTSGGALNSNFHCASWTSTSSPGGFYGRVDYNNSYWISVNYGSCAAAANLMCIAF